MKSSQLVSAVAFITGALVLGSSAQAALIDQYTTASSEFANVYAGGTGVNLYIEGAGVNRVVTLSVGSYPNYWKGVIPNTDVIDNGIASVTVNVPDTCDSTLTPSYTYGSDNCFTVNMTFTKGAYLWKTNGVTQYSWGNFIYQVIGGISTFGASTTGTVNGVDMTSSRAYMGKYTDVNVSVSTAN